MLCKGSPCATWCGTHPRVHLGKEDLDGPCMCADFGAHQIILIPSSGPHYFNTKKSNNGAHSDECWPQQIWWHSRGPMVYSLGWTVVSPQFSGVHRMWAVRLKFFLFVYMLKQKYSSEKHLHIRTVRVWLFLWPPVRLKSQHAHKCTLATCELPQVRILGSFNHFSSNPKTWLLSKSLNLRTIDHRSKC